MPNEIVAAAEIAQARINSDYRDTLGEHPDLTVERALLSLLSSPADHLEELLADWEWIAYEWEYHEKSGVPSQTQFEHRAETPIGDWQVQTTLRDNTKWEWAQLRTEPEEWHPCDSLESGKAACWADYVGRLRGAFKSKGARSC